MKLLHHLIRLGVPITFLTATLMPRAIPAILAIMHIEDMSIVNEIRAYMGRPNLKYVFKRVDAAEDVLNHAIELVRQQIQELGKDERGMIFTPTQQNAEELGEKLGIVVYHGSLPSKTREDAAVLWRNGIQPVDRFIACTEAFGAGIDEPHVRIVIHMNPKGQVNYHQETGRAG